MKHHMSLFCSIYALLIALMLVAGSAQAQQQCEGSAELCGQILQLQQQLTVQKAANQELAVNANNSGQTKKHFAFTAGMAAMLAIVLKTTVSAAKAWTSWLKTDRQKAIMKIVLLLLGFVAFVLTNLGFGLPWWEALVVAGGPPGAILVHELVDLFHVFGGKPLPPDSPGDPV